MYRKPQSVVGSGRESGNAQKRVGGIVSNNETIENFDALQGLTNELMLEGGGTNDQIKEVIRKMPNQSPETLARAKVMIDNMATFMLKANKDESGNLLYGFDTIFANADLDDETRLANAEKDLQNEGWLQGSLSDKQKEILLKTHNMFPEKGLFELNQQEKNAKIRSLLTDNVFNKVQAKLLLDRGYCAPWSTWFGKVSGMVGGIVSTAKVVGVVALIYFLTQMGGCEMLEGCGKGIKAGVEKVEDVAEGTSDVAEDIFDTGGNLLSPIRGTIKGVGAKMDKFFGTSKTKINTLRTKLSILNKQLEDTKKKIEEEDSKSGWFDSDLEDRLQEKQEELEEEIFDKEQDLEKAISDMIINGANERNVDIPAEKLSQMVEEAKNRTGDQWDSFWDGIGLSGGGSDINEEYKDADTDKDGNLTPEEIKEENKKKGYKNNFDVPVEK